MANYVNNPDFLKAISEYRLLTLDAKLREVEPPLVSRYIGECILKIATNLARKPNFSGYSYKEEMVSDGIENCLQYINNFNPEKSNNPFAYFTQIIYYAFLRRIAKEKRQSYIKGKMMMEVPDGAFDVQDQDDSSEFKIAYMDFSSNSNEVFESHLIRKSAARKLGKAPTKNSLDAFINDNISE
jgi:DNA-directed RNA polymerase specialized sigma24 family protein